MTHYNHGRTHQSIGMVGPFERFRLAVPQPAEAAAAPLGKPTASPAPHDPGHDPTVGRNGLISFAAAKYRAGVWRAGQDVTVVCDGALVHLHHRGVLIATHARRQRRQAAAGQRRPDSAKRRYGGRRAPRRINAA